LIRPSVFVPELVADLAELREIVPKCAVLLRGWDFPHVDRTNATQTGMDCVEQSTDWKHHVELWRLYQSGQFAFYGCLWDDWQDQSAWGPVASPWKVGQYLSVRSAIYTYTEVCEFAARLALSPVGSDQMVCDVTLAGLQGRQLTADNPHGLDFMVPQVATIPAFPKVRSLPRDELVAAPRDLAVWFSQQLFARFGWDAPQETLRNIQDELQR